MNVDTFAFYTGRFTALDLRGENVRFICTKLAAVASTSDDFNSMPVTN